VLTARSIVGVLLVFETAFLVSSGAPMWSSGTQLLPTTPAEVALKDAVGSSLVGFGTPQCPALGIRPNLNAAYSVRELGIYDPVTPLAYFSSWQVASGQSEEAYRGGNIFCPAVTTAALARRYGVAYVLEPPGSPGPVGAVFDRMIGDERLYRIPGAALATLTPVGRDGASPSPDGAGTPLTVSSTDPATWNLRTDATTPQVLRLRLTNVPGWKATIDGKPLRLAPFEGIMQQASIPAGRHTIEVHYWPTAFTVGIVLALCSAVGLGVAAVIAFVRSRRRPGSRELLSST
jgi:hypothetical protein